MMNADLTGLDQVPTEKEEYFTAMLEEGVVMVHLDPRREGVIVPAQFKEDILLRVNVAVGFNLPVFRIEHEALVVMLSFNRQNFLCTIPWTSVFCLTMPDKGHAGRIWEESFPPEFKQTEPPVIVPDTQEVL
jgi:stringent starvation protein B